MAILREVVRQGTHNLPAARFFPDIGDLVSSSDHYAAE
jgi:hypothetical protein